MDKPVTVASVLSDLGAPQELVDQAAVYEIERAEAAREIIKAMEEDGLTVSVKQGDDVFVSVAWLTTLLSTMAQGIMEGMEPELLNILEVLSDTISAANLYVEEPDV
jgi:hypothetical protein